MDIRGLYWVQMKWPWMDPESHESNTFKVNKLTLNDCFRPPLSAIFSP